MHQPLLPYTPERDVYRLLGVPSSASSDEIQAACRRLARTFHPDRNVSDRANQEMQVVNAVRRVMTDPGSRAAYDRERARFHATRARFVTAVATAQPGPVPRPTEQPPSEEVSRGSSSNSALRLSPRSSSAGSALTAAASASGNGPGGM